MFSMALVKVIYFDIRGIWIVILYAYHIFKVAIEVFKLNRKVYTWEHFSFVLNVHSP